MERKTLQGLTIQEKIRLSKRPLTPAEIHTAANKEVPNLGLATIYRHLHALSEKGLVAGVDYPGQPTRYEWADGRDKAHFSCRSCEKLFAFDETMQNEPALNAPKGFEIQGCEMMLYGTCPSCSKAQKE